jgi:ADP-ribose pyrophosphatase
MRMNMDNTANADKKWKLIKSKPVFQTKWLSVFENDYQLPDGRTEKGYYHLDRPDYVLVVAIDDKNRLILEKNYRRGVDGFVYELPAGFVDEEETPKQAAERELKEETGYFGNAVVIGEIYPQPAFSSMKAYVAFVRINEDLKGNQKLESDENIEFELMDFDDIKKKVKENIIKDMGLLSALEMSEDYIKGK